MRFQGRCSGPFFRSVSPPLSNDRTSNHPPTMTSPPTSNPPINPAQSTGRPRSTELCHTLTGHCAPLLTRCANRRITPIRIHLPTIPPAPGPDRRLCILRRRTPVGHARDWSRMHIALRRPYQSPQLCIGNAELPRLSDPTRGRPERRTRPAKSPLKIVEYAHNS